MKKVYTFWVYANVEVMVDASEEDHKKINAAITDDHINKNNYPDVHELLTKSYTQDIEPDMSDLFSLSVK